MIAVLFYRSDTTVEYITAYVYAIANNQTSSAANVAVGKEFVKKADLMAFWQASADSKLPASSLSGS